MSLQGRRVRDQRVAQVDRELVHYPTRHALAGRANKSASRLRRSCDPIPLRPIAASYRKSSVFSDAQSGVLETVVNAAHAIAEAKPAAGGKIRVVSRVEDNLVIVTISNKRSRHPRGDPAQGL
jgi:hypothetical protein